jgi:hypothetical protein
MLIQLALMKSLRHRLPHLSFGMYSGYTELRGGRYRLDQT